MGRLSGDPDQEFGGVRVRDVVLAIRDLEPGFHSVAEVRFLWMGVTGEKVTPKLAQVSRIVSDLGLTRYVQGGMKGWRIDPARLAVRWPRLPWVEMTLTCQEDAQAQMSAETVGWDHD